MAFITDKEQLKAANSSLTVDLDIESIQTYLLSADADFVVIIGTAARDELQARPAHVATVFMRAAVVDMAVAEYASSGAVEIDNTGISVRKSDTHLPASDKKLLAFKRDAYQRSWESFEHCVAAMEADLAVFTGWRDSVERRAYLSLLVDFSYQFNVFSGIKVSSHLFQLLRTEIRAVEEDTIAGILGVTLDADLRARKLAGTLEQKHRDLLAMIYKALAPLSVAGLIPYLAVQVSPTGIFQVSEVALSSGSDNVEQRSAAGGGAMQATMGRLVTSGESNLETLRKWLNDRAADFIGYTKNAIAPMAGINDDLKDTGVYFL